MSDDHGDENQSPDEVLRCPLCDAVFYHLDAYDIHLTFHSSEDMYSVKNEEYVKIAIVTSSLVAIFEDHAGVVAKQFAVCGFDFYKVQIFI